MVLSWRKCSQGILHVNLHAKRLTLILVPRVIIAAMLALALGSEFAPLGVMSSGHLCQMACCADEAPHEAGSCTHGSCQVKVPIRRPTPPKERNELCGPHDQPTAPHSAVHMRDTAGRCAYSGIRRAARVRPGCTGRSRARAGAVAPRAGFSRADKPLVCPSYSTRAIVLLPCGAVANPLT